MFIIRITEGQFISHSIGPENEFMIWYCDCWSSYHIPWITILVIQEHVHYQKHWRSIHLSLNWTWKWVYDLRLRLFIKSYSMSNDIGESGACSLSEALKINSSLTQLNLGVSLWFDTVIVHHHITFHEQQYWWFRRTSIGWCSGIKHHNHSDFILVNLFNDGSLSSMRVFLFLHFHFITFHLFVFVSVQVVVEWFGCLIGKVIWFERERQKWNKVLLKEGDDKGWNEQVRQT